MITFFKVSTFCICADSYLLLWKRSLIVKILPVTLFKLLVPAHRKPPVQKVLVWLLRPSRTYSSRNTVSLKSNWWTMIIANHLALSMKIEKSYRKPWPIFHVGNPVLPPSHPGPQAEDPAAPCPGHGGCKPPDCRCGGPQIPVNLTARQKNPVKAWDQAGNRFLDPFKRLQIRTLCCVSCTCSNLKVT